MAKIYISSTYEDLKPYRKAVTDQLTRMQHTGIVAMEQYIARDDRPLDVCIPDVTSSDLYVGLFAWRYGFVPKNDNPQQLSVTEFEYAAAGDARIPRLVFLLDDAVAWPPASFDSHTGENGGGARIRDLRKQLAEDHLISRFTSPDDLAAKLAAAVSLAGAVNKAPDATFDLADLSVKT